ncbi:hypothetical protein TrCOL_g8098 [Triparma columacea]|uniref:Uncharacterized protein n=1 Tax=Triparma columacea TaxID=722753 RepID=A0A9W7GG28_9STRA|nr:hypothetical protein TrCOL_g8098 [Triparma columacea]
MSGYVDQGIQVQVLSNVVKQQEYFNTAEEATKQHAQNGAPTTPQRYTPPNPTPTPTDEQRPQFRVLYLCITSEKMFSHRTYHIWRTIGQHINSRTEVNNSFLRFVSDVPTQMATSEEISYLREVHSVSLPPPIPWMPNNITSDLIPGDFTDYHVAQRRFLASAIRGHNEEVLRGTPWSGSKNNDNLWIFVFDDDAWVNDIAVRELIERKYREGTASESTITGQVQFDVPDDNTKSRFMGGGGGLYSPACVRNLKGLFGDERFPQMLDGVNGLYDIFMSKLVNGDGIIWEGLEEQGFGIEMKGNMGKLVDNHGFHSQPPNFYEQKEPLHDLGEMPVSFHSLDGPKQKDRGKRKRSADAYLVCGECPELYTQLYEKHYLGIKDSKRFVEDRFVEDLLVEDDRQQRRGE